MRIDIKSMTPEASALYVQRLINQVKQLLNGNIDSENIYISTTGEVATIPANSVKGLPTERNPISGAKFIVDTSERNVVLSVYDLMNRILLDAINNAEYFILSGEAAVLVNAQDIITSSGDSNPLSKKQKIKIDKPLNSQVVYKNVFDSTERFPMVSVTSVTVDSNQDDGTFLADVSGFVEYDDRIEMYLDTTISDIDATDEYATVWVKVDVFMEYLL
jgi:hypothetical protein